MKQKGLRRIFTREAPPSVHPGIQAYLEQLKARGQRQLTLAEARVATRESVQLTFADLSHPELKQSESYVRFMLPQILSLPVNLLTKLVQAASPKYVCLDEWRNGRIALVVSSSVAEAVEQILKVHGVSAQKQLCRKLPEGLPTEMANAA